MVDKFYQKFDTNYKHHSLENIERYRNVHFEMEIQKISKELVKEERDKKKWVVKDTSKAYQNQEVEVDFTNDTEFDQFGSMQGLDVLKAINESKQSASAPSILKNLDNYTILEYKIIDCNY